MLIIHSAEIIRIINSLNDIHWSSLWLWSISFFRLIRIFQLFKWWYSLSLQLKWISFLRLMNPDFSLINILLSVIVSTNSGFAVYSLVIYYHWSIVTIIGIIIIQMPRLKWTIKLICLQGRLGSACMIIRNTETIILCLLCCLHPTPSRAICFTPVHLAVCHLLSKKFV